MSGPITVAYRMSLRDIDAHFYEGAPDKIFCSHCDSVLDRSYIPSDFIVRNGRKLCIASTYDGKDICLSSVKHFLEKLELNIDFWKIGSKSDYFCFRPRNALAFDVEKRKTRFIGACSACGGYAEVIGSQPAYLKDVAEPLLHGIFRTDIEFGSGRGKGPLLIAGLHTKAVLEKAAYSGLSFAPIER